MTFLHANQCDARTDRILEGNVFVVLICQILEYYILGVYTRNMDFSSLTAVVFSVNLLPWTFTFISSCISCNIKGIVISLIMNEYKNYRDTIERCFLIAFVSRSLLLRVQITSCFS